MEEGKVLHGQLHTVALPGDDGGGVEWALDEALRLHLQVQQCLPCEARCPCLGPALRNYVLRTLTSKSYEGRPRDAELERLLVLEVDDLPQRI